MADMQAESSLKEKVLIMDDDPLFLKIIDKQLKALGFETVTVSDDFEKIEFYIEQNRPNIIIIDFFLGNIEGVTLMEKINKGYDIPVIFVTSSHENEVLEKILSVSPEGFIDKNRLNIAELKAMLHLTLYKSQRDRELKELNEKLDIKVKERTRELDQAVKALVHEMSEKEIAHKKLEKSLRAEKEFSRQKTDIISNLSHEFKTPLSSIMSSAQLIMRMMDKAKLSDEKYNKHINRILEGTEIMNDLIVRILSVERRENIALETQMLEMDLTTLIEEYKLKLEVFKQDQQEIIYQEDIKLGTVNIDPNLVELVLVNLISNALKYSKDEGSIEVSIQGIDNPPRLLVKVKDQGIGIGKEDLTKIFKRFYRGQNVGSIEGTGIGLSIVEQTLDILGGNIEVKSELNEGTQVDIEIPLEVNN